MVYPNCTFLYFVDFWNTRDHKPISMVADQLAAWLIPYGVVMNLGPKRYWLTIVLAVICICRLHRTKCRCMGCKMHELQSAQDLANVQAAKCAGPCKVCGPRYGCAVRQMHERARNAWAAVQLRRTHWICGRQLRRAVCGPHCPRTYPALAMQCPRNTTAVPLVGRNEPQLPGTLRVKEGVLHLWSQFGDLAWMGEKLSCG